MSTAVALEDMPVFEFEDELEDELMDLCLAEKEAFGSCRAYCEILGLEEEVEFVEWTLSQEKAAAEKHFRLAGIAAEEAGRR